MSIFRYNPCFSGSSIATKKLPSPVGGVIRRVTILVFLAALLQLWIYLTINFVRISLQSLFFWQLYCNSRYCRNCGLPLDAELQSLFFWQLYCNDHHHDCYHAWNNLVTILVFLAALLQHTKPMNHYIVISRVTILVFLAALLQLDKTA